MAGLSGITGLGGDSGIFGGAATYIDKVVGHDPDAYWVLNETAGGTAADQINSPAQDGSYTACTLANTLGPDGVNYAPLFDGATSFVNIYTATLAGAFNGAAGTAMIWAKVFNAGVWTDGTDRYMYDLRVDGNNQVQTLKRTVNNTVRWRYEANNVIEDVTDGAINSTGWNHYAITWSKAAEQMKAYYNGSQDGATQITLGVWAGALAATTTTIGAFNTTPTGQWYGWLAHMAVWDSALSGPDIADLAAV